MTKCLNCDAPIKLTEGRRPRKFCDNKGKCRLAYWNKNNPKEGKYVLKSTHEKIVKQLSDKLNGAINKQFEKESDYLAEALAGKETTTKGIVNQVKEIPSTDHDTRLIEDRIKVLEAELKSPPKTAVIGVKTWIKIRERELAELKAKLNQ